MGKKEEKDKKKRRLEKTLLENGIVWGFFSPFPGCFNSALGNNLSLQENVTAGAAPSGNSGSGGSVREVQSQASGKMRNITGGM